MAAERTRVMTAKEAWLGGLYILELYYPLGSPLSEPLAALWSFPALEGPVASRNAEVWEQYRLDLRSPPACLDDDLVGLHMYGALSMSTGSECACESIASRWEDREHIGLFLPWGSLGYVYPTDYENDRAWIEEVDELLVRLAEHVFDRVPFVRGLIGYELGWDDDDDAAFQPGDVPKEHTSGVLDVRDGTLTYHPPTPTRWLG